MMKTHEELVWYLKEEVRVLKSTRLEVVFRAVDRACFVPEKLRDGAYEDCALPIGFGATISQPTTVAFMLEKLDVREGHHALDIGSGSGWTTALLAYLVGEKGRVVGVEIVPKIVACGRENLQRWRSNVLKNNRITGTQVLEIRQAERGVVGFEAEGPYDRILVSAAAKEIPEGLVRQLAPDGVMVVPVGKEGEIQKLVRAHKRSDGRMETEEYPGFIFVPLR